MVIIVLTQWAVLRTQLINIHIVHRKVKYTLVIIVVIIITEKNMEIYSKMATMPIFGVWG